MLVGGEKELTHFPKGSLPSGGATEAAKRGAACGEGFVTLANQGYWLAAAAGAESTSAGVCSSCERLLRARHCCPRHTPPRPSCLFAEARAVMDGLQFTDAAAEAGGGPIPRSGPRWAGDWQMARWSRSGTPCLPSQASDPLPPPEVLSPLFLPHCPLVLPAYQRLPSNRFGVVLPCV